MILYVYRNMPEDKYVEWFFCNVQLYSLLLACCVGKIVITNILV